MRDCEENSPCSEQFFLTKLLRYAMLEVKAPCAALGGVLLFMGSSEVRGSAGSCLKLHMFVMSVLFAVLAELHPRFPRLAILRKTSANQKSDGSMRYISHWAHIENIEISSTPPAYGHATTSKYIIFRLFELPSFHWHLAAPVSCPVVSLVLTMS